MKFIMPTINISLERWKWNEEYKLYVSTKGHFKNANKTPVRCKVRGNYFFVKIGDKWVPAHRIVLMTWKPNVNAGNLTVDHLNSNTRDNRLNNLEWVTAKENSRRGEENTFNISDVVITSTPCLADDPYILTIPEDKPITFSSLGINPQINSVQWSTILSMVKNNKILFRTDGEVYTAWQYQNKYRPEVATNVDNFIRKSALAAAREEAFHGRKVELVMRPRI